MTSGAKPWKRQPKVQQNADSTWIHHCSQQPMVRRVQAKEDSPDFAFNGLTNPRRPRTLEVQNFSFKVRCRPGVCRVPIQKPSIKRRHQQNTHRADDTKVANLSLRQSGKQQINIHRIVLGSCCQETVLAPTSTWKYVVTGACSAPPKDATQIPSIGTLAE